MMKLNLPDDRIAEFCRKWNVAEFALFGSVLREDFRPDSDVDVLVSFLSYESTPSLFEHIDMQDELESIFGRPVDLVSKRGVEKSENRFRKKAILDSARVVYAAP
jgi:predicted nucleotidyltransferase